MPSREAECVGALIGTFVGDALGAPVEGRSTDAIRADHGRLDQMLPERGGPGVYTDDTQLTIALAEAILEANGIDEQVVADRMLALHDPARGYGAGTTRVFRKWEQGVPVSEASGQIFEGGSFGNGGSMRIASVAAAYHPDLEALRQAARRSCRITHAHPLGIVGAQLQARAVAEAIRAEPREAEPLGMLGGIRQGGDADLDDGTYERAMDEVEDLLVQPGRPDVERVAARLGNDSRAFASVPAAIYTALANADSFEEAVVDAVMLGGDTDTIAAMAGAIAGGLHGVQAVPGRWWRALEDGPRGREHVVELGEGLAAIAGQA